MKYHNICLTEGEEFSFNDMSVLLLSSAPLLTISLPLALLFIYFCPDSFGKIHHQQT